MTTRLLQCLDCNQYLIENVHFMRYSTSCCRACRKKKADALHARPAYDIFRRFKRQCRQRGLVEGKLWSLKDVEVLLENTEHSPVVLEAIAQGIQPKLWIVRVDKSKALLPGNAVLRV